MEKFGFVSYRYVRYEIRVNSETINEENFYYEPLVCFIIVKMMVKTKRYIKMISLKNCL